MKEAIFIGIASIIGFVLLFLFLSGLAFVQMKNTCETWTRESERESKFVYNYPWYADCLTKTESGWISAKHLYQQETPNISK